MVLLYTVLSVVCFTYLAMANLRAALVALTSATANPQAAGSGVVLPGCVVLVSNLNEKV